MRISLIDKCLLVLLVLVSIVVINTDATADKVILEDDFDQADYTSPDGQDWIVTNTSSDGYVYIKNNSLDIRATGTGESSISSRLFQTRNLTLHVDCMVSKAGGRPISVEIYSNRSGWPQNNNAVNYMDGKGWSIFFRIGSGGAWKEVNKSAIKLNTWYSINISIEGRKFFVTVIDTSTNETVVSWNRTDTEPLIEDNYVDIYPHGDLESHWDNFSLYDTTVGIESPAWLPMPTFHAVEDIDVDIDLSQYARDPDSPPSVLTFISPSRYVTNTLGSVMTFNFPNNVTSAEIPVFVSDGHTFTVGVMNWSIEPVNDAPQVLQPLDFEAVEDVPRTVDLSSYVSDIDNDLSQLTLSSEDPFITVHGLKIEVTFTEGTLRHTSRLNLTDGDLSVEFSVRFTVQPVDDPPVLAALKPLSVLEDKASTLDLSDGVTDVDTPKGDLVVRVTSPNCTVDGLLLTFLYTLGGINETVWIHLTDGTTEVSTAVEVRVLEVNDPPVVDTLEPRLVDEDVALEVDIGPFVHDEDNDASELRILCDDPAVEGSDGLRMTLLYTVWVDSYVLEFEVFDGVSKGRGELLVQVRERNDPPVIHNLERMQAVELNEGEDRHLDIEASDEEDGDVYLSVDGWAGASIDDGRLHLVSEKGHVGEFQVHLYARDKDGGEDAVEFNITVLNVNDPPSIVQISPDYNHTVWAVEDEIDMIIVSYDPDFALGQSATISVISDISGELLSLETTGGESHVNLTSLNVGRHRLVFRISDGEASTETWIELEVEDETIEPDDDHEVMDYSLHILVAIVVVAVGTVALSWRRWDTRGSG